MRNNATKKFLTVITTLTLCASFPRATHAESPNDILIIANTFVPVNAITLDEVRDLFLKRRLSWNGNTSAMPINAPDGSVLRAAFLKNVLELSATDEARYWEEQKIKRGLIAPPAFENALMAVFRMKGAVSYVRRADYKKGVAKVLLTVPCN